MNNKAELSKHLARELASLARTYAQQEDASLYSLLEATGYMKHKTIIGQDEIQCALSEHPEYLDDWIEYSANKRVDQGWFYHSTATGKFEIGYFGPTTGYIHCRIYVSKLDACVQFLLYELSDLIAQNEKA